MKGCTINNSPLPTGRIPAKWFTGQLGLTTEELARLKPLIASKPEECNGPDTADNIFAQNRILWDGAVRESWNEMVTYAIGNSDALRDTHPLWLTACIAFSKSAWGPSDAPMSELRAPLAGLLQGDNGDALVRSALSKLLLSHDPNPRVYPGEVTAYLLWKLVKWKWDITMRTDKARREGKSHLKQMMCFQNKQIHQLQEQLDETRAALIWTRLDVKAQKQDIVNMVQNDKEEIMGVLAGQERKHVALVEKKKLELVRMVTQEKEDRVNAMESEKQERIAMEQTLVHLFEAEKEDRVNAMEAEKQERIAMKQTLVHLFEAEKAERLHDMQHLETVIQHTAQHTDSQLSLIVAHLGIKSNPPTVS